jgi:hypothetical protein
MRDVTQMKERQHTIEWTLQRYEYYLAGRTLWLCNQMEKSALMLAYSIEAHIKHLLSRQKEVSQKLQYDHDIPKLFGKSRDLGLFADVEVSEDLLRYVQDHFHSRYPSQKKETINRAMNRGHTIGLDPTRILAYDDLILQLDQSLWRALHDVRASVALMGGKGASTAPGRFFFYSNHVAIDLLEDIKIMLEEDFSLFLREEHERLHEMNRQDYLRRQATLADKDRLLGADNQLMRITPRHGTTNFRNHAKIFTSPGKYYELPDGARVFSHGF